MITSLLLGVLVGAVLGLTGAGGGILAVFRRSSLASSGRCSVPPRLR